MRERPFWSEALTKQHNKTAFTCGIEALDRYLRNQAGQDRRNNVAVTYVLVDELGGDVRGYYSLSTTLIIAKGLPLEVIKKLPRYPEFPAILIGRLAVDAGLQGQGVGSLLFLDALSRCLDVSDRIGAMAVVVDLQSESVQGFYARHGFKPLLDDRVGRMYLPMATIAIMVQDTGSTERR